MVTKTKFDRGMGHNVPMHDHNGHRWETPYPVDARNKMVSYGIHTGRYPIGGMLVGDARRALRKLINIDDSAVAVINGSRVDESEQIMQDVTMLSFVKPSAMKG